MLFLILVTVIIFLYFLYYDSINENFISLYKCPKLRMGHMYDKVLEVCSINRIKDSKECDIYMPCGYNNVENELKTLKLQKFQKVYGINGCDNIVSKNGLWNILENYYGRKNASLLMPETFILNSENNMNIFQKEFSPNNIYLLKKNIQRKLGISLTSDINYILSQKHTSFKVVQKYVKDLFLINKRKVNLRLYLLIVCHKKNIRVYLHKYGKCIYTNKDIDDLNYEKLDPEKHLTSLNLTKEVYNNRPETLEQLKNYLGKYHYNILMKNIKYNLMAVINAFKSNVCKLSSLYNHTSFQLFGIDYLFNKSMFPYLLEMNKGPDMSSKSETDFQTKEIVLTDVFKVTKIIKNKPKHRFIRLS